MEAAKETLKALKILIPNLQKGPYSLKPRTLADAPFWLTAAVEVYSLDYQDGQSHQLTLIRPRAQLTFDQIQNVYRHIAHRTGPRTLLIADGINARLRPLLVKFRIPFIYKDETVFAPDMGMVISHLRSFEEKVNLQAIPLKDELHSLSVKLLAGYLTGHLKAEFSLKDLHGRIDQCGGTASSSHLSRILQELVQFEFLKTEGSGPQKRFAFEARSKVWDLLQITNLAFFMRPMLVYQIRGDVQEYVLGGESALAQYADLVTPKTTTKAIALARYNAMDKNYKEHFTASVEPNNVIQLWREDPRLFSRDGKINQIELYLSMRENTDERIQIALSQMLSKLGLQSMERG